VVRFEVPKKIGIGLSSGTVCRLVSGDNKTLDYSGKTLNLASRLMEFARPSGVVFDSSVGIELLPPELGELFVKDKVCVRGIEDKLPVVIYHTKDTVILPSDREPETMWRQHKKRVTARALTHFENFPGPLRIDLPTPAADPKSIALTASFELPKLKREGDKGTIIMRFASSQLDYGVIGGKAMLRVETKKVTKMVREHELNPDQIVTFEVSYVE